MYTNQSILLVEPQPLLVLMLRGWRQKVIQFSFTVGKLVRNKAMIISKTSLAFCISVIFSQINTGAEITKPPSIESLFSADFIVQAKATDCTFDQSTSQYNRLIINNGATKKGEVNYPLTIVLNTPIEKISKYCIFFLNRDDENAVLASSFCSIIQLDDGMVDAASLTIPQLIQIMSRSLLTDDSKYSLGSNAYLIFKYIWENHTNGSSAISLPDYDPTRTYGWLNEFSYAAISFAGNNIRPLLDLKTNIQNQIFVGAEVKQPDLCGAARLYAILSSAIALRCENKSISLDAELVNKCLLQSELQKGELGASLLRLVYTKIDKSNCAKLIDMLKRVGGTDDLSYQYSMVRNALIIAPATACPTVREFKINRDKYISLALEKLSKLQKQSSP